VRVFGNLGAERAGGRPAAHDERVETAQRLLERLAARWTDSPYPSFRVEVLESEDLNAGALPGGLIVVTTRLLDEIETENELAFVLGHELGHFRGRHHLRRLGRGAAWGLGLAVLGGSGHSVPNLASLVAGLTARGFDRDQEREADRFGLQLVQAEYGHVEEAAGFLERLDAESRLVAYVSTHPASTERLEELNDYAREQGWPLTGPSVPLSPAEVPGPAESDISTVFDNSGCPTRVHLEADPEVVAHLDDAGHRRRLDAEISEPEPDLAG
jgi:predicted Zn-dependent protease